MAITVIQGVPSEANAYQPYGAALDLFYSHESEFVLDGPAGTGKSRACLEKLHICANKYPEMRALIVRKTRASLTQTGIVTFEKHVLPANTRVKFRSTEQEYRYPNGSTIAVGGLDKPTKIMSAEYDLIFVQEAVEATENDWESLTTRLRNGKIPYQQLIADCNPDSPTHWLKKRADAGRTRMLASRHEDNPTLFDRRLKTWTEKGKAYIEKLDALTGVRYQRLRKGLWVQAEGVVYESFDRAKHLIDRFKVPDSWTRWWAIDFGFTNPFVWQEWAEDSDGRLYLVQEIYRTKTLVEDHAKMILEATKNSPRPAGIICDHDAEDRATLERHLKMQTIAALKTVSPGIQKVETRYRPAADGKPRIFILRDSLVHPRDEFLEEAKKPCATVEEIEGYIWDLSANRRKSEQPVKKDDHGCDGMRYLVAEIDIRRVGGEVEHGESIW